MNQRELKEALHYDPKTGIFKWKVDRKYSRKRKGEIAGYVRDNQYIVIQFGGKNYYAHRLAWFYVYDYWPKEIDHINRNKTDNRLKNLRVCTRSENRFNMDKYSNNTSGVKGVYWYKQQQKWVARISKEGKSHFLGYFDTKQKAAKARQQAEKELLCH